MSRVHIEPCPFCANPRPRLGRWFSGPFLSAGTDGQFMGWQVYCWNCHARARVRYVKGRITLSAVRCKAISTWNARTHTEAPKCPCCGAQDAREWVGLEDPPLTHAEHSAIAHVTCACGLEVIGYRVENLVRMNVTLSDAMPVWMTRTPPADWHDALDDYGYAQYWTPKAPEPTGLGDVLRSAGKRVVLRDKGFHMVKPVPEMNAGSIGCTFGLSFGIEDAEPDADADADLVQWVEDEKTERGRRDLAAEVQRNAIRAANRSGTRNGTHEQI